MKDNSTVTYECLFYKINVYISKITIKNRGRWLFICRGQNTDDDHSHCKRLFLGALKRRSCWMEKGRYKRRGTPLPNFFLFYPRRRKRFIIKNWYKIIIINFFTDTNRNGGEHIIFTHRIEHTNRIDIHLSFLNTMTAPKIKHDFEDLRLIHRNATGLNTFYLVL